VLPSSSEEVLVEDSFIMPSSDPVEHVTEVIGANDRFNDALSQAIKETMALAHLPLDDEDAESPPSTAVDEDDEGTDEEPTESVARPRKTLSFVSKASTLRDKGLNLNTFQCMDPSNSGYSPKNPNSRTIQILEEMCKHYD
jgi:DNA polymerase IV